MPEYVPQDEQYLWCLLEASQPRLVGTLRLIRQSGPAVGGVSLEYAASWLADGFALSEDLPLRAGEVLPHEKHAAAGAVDDARPDRWGERVIRQVMKPPRLSTIEYLYFAGDERFGALGVSLLAERYAPRPHGALAQLADIDMLRELAQRVENGEPVEDRMRRLIAPGTLGGARPKAVVDIDGRHWVVKFSERGDDFDSPLVEHAAMSLARRGGIDACQTRPIALRSKDSHRGTAHAVAVERFDRPAAGRRVHAQTASVALHAAGERLGYPELALLLRRRGDDQKIVPHGEELFRRMLLNILIDNTDDHEKNHAVLREDSGFLTLAPAYDVLPTAQSLGYQSFKVGAFDADPTIENALSEASSFKLTQRRARELCREIGRLVDGWADHFRGVGVSAHDLGLLATHIDREALRRERGIALRA